MPTTKLLQVRNVPADLHRKLKVRAAQKGMTLSDYVLDELEQIADLPPLDDWLEELHKQPPAKLKRPVADVIREERDSR